MISWLGRTFRAKNDMDTISHITRYEIWYIDLIYILQKILHRMGENYRKSRKKIRQWPQPNQQEIFIKIFKKKNNLPCESKIILVKSECPKFLKKQNFLQLILTSLIKKEKWSRDKLFYKNFPLIWFRTRTELENGKWTSRRFLH